MLDDFIQAVIGVIIIIALVVIFAPILLSISSITNTQVIGYAGVVMLFVFAGLVIFVTIMKLKD